MQIKARRCFVPFSPSRWVAKVYLTCDNTIAVEYRHGQHVKKILPQGPGAYLGKGGVPRVCCLYPGTQGDLAEFLYELAEVWSYGGEWVHAFLYKKFGYRLVSSPSVCGNCNTTCSLSLSPANPTNGQAVTITATITNTDGSPTRGEAPEGTVAITVDGTNLCTQTLPEDDPDSTNVRSVSCTWTATCSPSQTHTLAATYTPSESDFASSSGSTSVTVSGCGGTPCCPAGLPTILHLTISGSGSCGIDGTYPITWNGTIWAGSTGVGNPLQFYCNAAGSPPPCGFSLVVWAQGAVCYEVGSCGSTSGTWASASCSGPNFTSNPTNVVGGSCGCLGNGATFTVTQ
jgi:hypothetical protein